MLKIKTETIQDSAQSEKRHTCYFVIAVFDHCLFSFSTILFCFVRNEMRRKP